MARRLATIAKWINENIPELEAEIEESFCNTDRKYKGSRLRFPGKGRTGNRLLVWLRSMPRHERTQVASMRTSPNYVYCHDGAETYRSNSEVEEWLKEFVTLYRAPRPRGCKVFIPGSDHYPTRRGDCKTCGKRHKWPKDGSKNTDTGAK